MKQATLRAILRTRLSQVADLPLVIWEATNAAIGAVVRIEDELRAGTAFNLASGATQTRPLYLLTIHSPPDKRIAELDRLADAISNAFEPGRTLTDDARTHFLEITTLDAGAHRTLASGWGYRRCTVGLSATAFRTTLQPA